MAESAWHPRELAGLVKQAAQGWSDDDAPSMGAALAYYTLFSIAPLLMIVIAVAGTVFGEQAARGEIMGELSGLLGPEGAQALETMLKSVKYERSNPWAAAASLGALLVGATTVFAALQSSLNRIWRDSHAVEPQHGLWAIVRTRLLSLGIILCLGFLSLVSLVFNAAVTALGQWWAPYVGDISVLGKLADFSISFGVVTVMFAMLYKWVPAAKVHWHDVWVGAVATAALFSIGKSAIGYYIGRSGVTTAFGAAASVVVLMVWVYYSAQIFLMGAELTWAYACRFGSMKDRITAADGGSSAELR
ncbi:YihY/virulence factor BrkB family protein [Ideonella sp. DXS29W]|uniref:YihY/virulence factor BrkB family protein n=1 Tax=Ideonella lacteola TaxID=2984193 RepID=A0ABU9BT48_9BURK